MVCIETLKGCVDLRKEIRLIMSSILASKSRFAEMLKMYHFTWVWNISNVGRAKSACDFHLMFLKNAPKNDSTYFCTIVVRYCIHYLKYKRILYYSDDGLIKKTSNRL